MEKDRKIAGAAPESLILAQLFHGRNLVLFLFLGMIAGAMLLLMQLAPPRLNNPVDFLSFGIFLLPVVGIWFAIREMTRIRIENAVSRITGAESDQVLTEVRAKERARIELNEVEGMLPANPSPMLFTPELFRRVIALARDRKFETAVILTQPIKDLSSRALYRIKLLQSFCLKLGILGTFMGLIFAFSNLKLSSDATALAASLDTISDALKFSFATSIAGIIGAVILGLIFWIVSRRQETFYREMDGAVESLIALTRNSINRDDFISEFTQVGYAVRELSSKTHAQTMEIHRQNQALEAGLTGVQTVGSHFETWTASFLENQRVFLENVRQSYDLLSPAELSELLAKQMENALAGVRETVRKSLGDLDSNFANMNTFFTTMQKNILDLEMKHEARSNALLEQHRALMSSKSDLVDSTREMMKNQKSLLEVIKAFDVREELKASYENISETLTASNDQIGDRIEAQLRLLTREIAGFSRVMEKDLIDRRSRGPIGFLRSIFRRRKKQDTNQRWRRAR